MTDHRPDALHVLIEGSNGGIEGRCSWPFECTHGVNRLAIGDLDDHLSRVRKGRGTTQHRRWRHGRHTFHKPADDFGDLFIRPARAILAYLLQVDHDWK